MTDRIPLDHLNSDQYDALCNELAALREVARGYCPACGRGDAAPTLADWEEQRKRAEQAETERDGAYRERAHLVALLAALYPSVITLAPDVDEPGWKLVFITMGGSQMSWHISPRDDDLFEHVERVTCDDPRAQWDGHTTEEKYERMRALTATQAAPGTAATQATDDTDQAEAASLDLREEYAKAVEGCGIESLFVCGEIADAIHAVRDREMQQLRAKIAEMDHAINWHTTCTSCARVLDSSIRETERAETAEQQRDEWETTAYRHAKLWRAAEQQRDQLAGVLREVLAQTPALSVRRDDLKRWRAALNPPKEKP